VGGVDGLQRHRGGLAWANMLIRLLADVSSMEKLKQTHRSETLAMFGGCYPLSSFRRKCRPRAGCFA
jgi:hypothetical protein